MLQKDPSIDSIIWTSTELRVKNYTKITESNNCSVIHNKNNQMIHQNMHTNPNSYLGESDKLSGPVVAVALSPYTPGQACLEWFTQCAMHYKARWGQGAGHIMVSHLPQTPGVGLMIWQQLINTSRKSLQSSKTKEPKGGKALPEMDIRESSKRECQISYDNSSQKPNCPGLNHPGQSK